MGVQTSTDSGASPSAVSRTPGAAIVAFFWRHLVLGAALAALLASVVLPVEGLGISLCFFYDVTGLPCPGCGLTRSVTSISHLRFQEAWFYNPFGFPIHATFVLMAIYGILPRALRERCRHFFTRRARLIQWTAVIFLGALQVFGVVRLILYLVSGKNFPEPL